MGYAARYVGGFIDYPTLSTPIDSAFLNAVEAALLRVDVGSPSTNYVPVWDGTKFTAQQLTNSQISASAAIAKSKIDFGSGLANADIATAAAIAYSKLNLASSIVTGDIVDGTIVNGDISASAAIAVTKAPHTYSQNVLAADVTMTTAGTFYDGPSVTVAAGTWLLTAIVCPKDGAAVGTDAYYAKLWDGTTSYATAQGLCAVGATSHLSLVGIVVPVGSTTYKASMTSSRNGNKIGAAMSANSPGNYSSVLTAVQIA